MPCVRDDVTTTDDDCSILKKLKKNKAGPDQCKYYVDYKEPTRVEPLEVELLNKAYLAGFNASGEGYNGEYPFQDKGLSQENDSNWIEKRNAVIDEFMKG
jgi:hypothetical protein